MARPLRVEFPGAVYHITARATQSIIMSLLRAGIQTATRANGVRMTANGLTLIKNHADAGRNRGVGRVYI